MPSKISPKIYAEALYEVTKDVSPEKVPEVITSYVQSVSKQRISDSLWKKIVAAFKKTYNDREGIVEAHVTLRARITPEETKEVTHFLKELYPGKHITIIDHIDERVLGGIKIQVEDSLFDFTVQNSLKTLEKQLMER